MLVLLHTDMVGAIEMTVVTEDMKIVKDPQQNMVHEDTMNFSTDLTILKVTCTASLVMIAVMQTLFSNLFAPVTVANSVQKLRCALIMYDSTSVNDLKL